MQDSHTSSSGTSTPGGTPMKHTFGDGKYSTPESPDTFPYVHGNIGLNAPGTGTKVIQRCMTDLDDLISRRKKELSDIQHSGLKSSHKKKSAVEFRTDIKPIPMAGLSSTPGRKIKESDADIKRDLHIVEEEESAFSETLEELLMHSESHNTTKITTTTVTHSHLHFDLGDGNGHNNGNNHNKTAEEEELHELRHLYKTSQSKIALLEEKIVQMELHVEANMTGNSQRAKLQAEERTKLQAQRTQLEDELSSANEEIQFLKVQLQNKSARLLDLETELTQAQREIQDLRNKMEEDAEALRRQGSSRSLFDDEAILKNVSSEDKIGKEPAVLPEVIELRQQLAAAQEEVSSLETELALVKSEYENVVREKGLLQSAVDGNSEEKAKLQLKIAELEYSLTQADAKVFESEVAAAEAENKYEDLEHKSKERVEQLRKEIVALMKLNESLQGDIKSLQKTNKDLSNEGSANDDVIAELKKQHSNELQKAKNALVALADKHAAQIADLKEQHEKERDQQLSDALMAVADVSDLQGRGTSAPSTPAGAAAAPVKQSAVLENVEIPAAGAGGAVAVVEKQKPRSSTAFYLGLALLQAGVWSLLLFLAYMYINHVDLVSEFPIRLVPYRYTS